MKKFCSTRSASIWGFFWRNPKLFLISTSFKGCTTHFRVDLFYIVHRFSLSPEFAGQSEGWVKFYNVKKVKTEMTCAPLKKCQNKISFWIPSKWPPNTYRAGWANFVFIKKMFSWNILRNTLSKSREICMFTPKWSSSLKKWRFIHKKGPFITNI